MLSRTTPAEERGEAMSMEMHVDYEARRVPFIGRTRETALVSGAERTVKRRRLSDRHVAMSLWTDAQEV